MESNRVLKIEKFMGFALVATCAFRVASHKLESVAVIGDILGKFGAILYFRVLFIQHKQD
jgi:hypothetical protein